MTRWKKDETQFTVRLSFDGNNSKSCRILKPTLEKLGSPNSVTFQISKNDNITIFAGGK